MAHNVIIADSLKKCRIIFSVIQEILLILAFERAYLRRSIYDFNLAAHLQRI